MKEVEIVDFNPVENAQQLIDPSIKSNRQLTSTKRGNVGTEGELQVVLCADNYDDMVSAVMQNDWSSNVLTIGTTQKHFSFEQGFMDMTGGAQYRVFTGMTPTKMSIKASPESFVEASFSLLGMGTSAFSGTSLDDSPTAVTAKTKFTHDGGTFKEGGSTVGYLTSIEMELDNNAAGNYALGNTAYRNISSGKAIVTGRVTAMFESVALYNKFKNNTSSSIEFTLTDGTDTLTFKMSQVKYGTGVIRHSGDGPVEVEVGFTAEEHATDGTLKITRSA